MIPKWLDDAMAALGLGGPLNAADREAIAEAVLAAIPKDILVAAIRASTRAVLKQRGIADANDDLAGEIARNSAHSVLTHFEVGSHEDLERKAS